MRRREAVKNLAVAGNWQDFGAIFSCWRMKRRMREDPFCIYRHEKEGEKKLVIGFLGKDQ